MEPPAASDDEARGSHRLITIAALTAGLALLVWMGRGLVAGTVPFTGDLLHFHYPLRAFYARALSEGHGVAWMPGLFNGFYVVGEGQLGAYHPLHWLLYRWLALPTAFAVEIVIAYPFAFAGTWLWLRRRCGAPGASVAALLFATCGFNFSHGVHPNMVGVVAHLPWLLWAVDGATLAASWRAGLGWSVAIAVAIASQLLLGHPQAAWISGLAVASYTLVGVVGGPAGARARTVGLVVAGGVIGLGMGAVQVLATLDATAHSLRATFEPSFATQFALTPARLLSVVQPYARWGRVLRWNELPGAGDEYGVYLGAFGVVLGAWWLAQLWTSRRAAPSDLGRLGGWAAGLCAAGLWLATGAHGGLYLLQTALPVVGQFRAPVRYVLFAQLAVACLAGCAVATLVAGRVTGRDASRRALWAPWLLTVLVVAVTPFLHPPAGAPAASSWAIWLGPFVFVVAALLLTLIVRGGRWALPLLVVCAAADQALYGLGGVVAWQDAVPHDQVVPLLGEARFRPAPTDGRIVRGGFPNLYLLGGYRLVDGYVAIAPRKQLRYDRLSALRLSEVRYAHVRVLAPAITEGATLLDGKWFAVPDPLPRLRLVSHVRVSRTPEVDIETLDPAVSALVDRAMTLDPTPAGTTATTADVPGRVEARVTAPGRQLLVLSESYDEGWTATVDGRPVEVVRVNGDFLGCVVPAGTHYVALVFAPAHLAWGKQVSLGALLVAGLLWGIGRRGANAPPANQVTSA